MTKNVLRFDIFFITFVFSLVFIQYSNTLYHHYAFDDYLYIVGNEHLEGSWQGVYYFFTHIYTAEESINRIYRPTVFVSYIIERALFGKSPQVLHFFNVFYFAVLSSLLYVVLRKLTAWCSQSRAIAFLVVLLFIVQPVHTEVVANIKSRDEIFSLLGCLSSFYFLLVLLEGKSRINLLFAFFCFVFALFSKFNALTFLGLISLAVWYCSSKQFSVFVFLRRTFIITALFLIGVLGYKGVQKMVQAKHFGKRDKLAKTEVPTYKATLANVIADPDLSPEQRIGTALGLLPRYFQMLFLGKPLPYYSGYPFVKPLHIYELGALFGLLLYVTMFGLGLYLFISRKPFGLSLNNTKQQHSQSQIIRLVGMGILWFFICLSIYANLIKLAPDTFAVRYLFAPSVGYCMAFVLGLALLFRVDFDKPIFLNRVNGLFLGILCCICLYYSFVTWERNKAWKNSYTLFAQDMDILDNCARAHTYMASALIARNNENKSPSTNNSDKINHHYERATQLFPLYADAYNYWAKYLMSINKPEEAQKVCEQATAQNPTAIASIFCLGEAFYAANNYNQAIVHLENALVQQKELKKGYDFLSWSYYKTQQAPKAQQTLDSALVHFPNNDYFWREKGKMYFLDKQMPLAIACLEKAYQLKKQDPQTLHMLANALIEIGDTLAAKRYAKEFNAQHKQD